MKHIFYIIGIWFMVYELRWIMNPAKRIKMRKFYYKHKHIPHNLRGNKLKKLLGNYAVENVILFFWLIVGLFTFNWFLFAAILIFNVIVIGQLNKKANDYWFLVINWLNSVIGFVFVIFIIVNEYHLRIDLASLLNIK